MATEDGEREQAGQSGGLSGVAKAGVAVTAVAATAVGAKKLISSWRERRAGGGHDGKETPAARDADEAKRLARRRDDRGDRAAEGGGEEDLATTLERAAFQAAVGAASAVVDRLGGQSGESRGDAAGSDDDRAERAD